MSVLRVALAAFAVARSPIVRAGLRAAPRLITPAMREKTGEATLSAAYQAGVLARKLMARR